MSDEGGSHGGWGRIWNKESIPTELKNEKQWLVAKITESEKPPLYPRSPTAVDHGLSFDDIEHIIEDPDLGFIDTNQVSEGDQIIPGFMIAPDDEYYFIDWDDVRDPDVGNASVPRSVVEWIEEVGGYTEVSPSGTGLKTICRSNGEMQSAVELSKFGKIYLDNPPIGDAKNKPHVDVYIGGQYTTVTGDVFQVPYEDHSRCKLSDGGSVLSKIEAKQLSSNKTGSNNVGRDSAPKQNSLTDIGRQSIRKWKYRQKKDDNKGSQLIDGEWIKTDDPTIEQIVATGCALDDSFRRLWNGNVSGYPTVSEADCALVSKIWYYADDKFLVNAVFKQSKLYGIRPRRPSLSDWTKPYPRWDVDSYRRSTIEQARDNDRHQGRYLDPSD